MKAEKTFTFLSGYTTNRPNMNDTQIALYLARKLHKDQKRKSGEPYILHPLVMASHAVALGIDDDVVLASCLLHDVLEDCNVTPMMLENAGLSKETVCTVELLTKSKVADERKEERDNQYYENLRQSHKACIVKLLDRCNNISTMLGAFTVEKMQSYCVETERYILPLAKELKETCPKYRNAIMILKYQINSIMDAVQFCGYNTTIAKNIVE